MKPSARLVAVVCLYCTAQLSGLIAVTPAAGAVRLLFVGDIMLDDGPGKQLAAGVDPFAHCASLLEGADFTIGNLECVVAIGGARVEKPYNFRADLKAIPLLKKYFDAVSVANNHSGDFGPGALVEQCELFERDHLKYFGGGRNLADAHRPLVIELHGLRIAVLGYNEFRPREFEAGVNRAGVAWSVDERVLRDIRLARSQAKADIVIPFMHWGEEEESMPSERQRTFARAMVDAGADLVVGGHPHITQGAEYHRGHLIVYSLGNFVFDGWPTDSPCRDGWLLELELEKQGLVKWKTLVVRADDQGIPHPQPNAKSPRGRAGDPQVALDSGP